MATQLTGTLQTIPLGGGYNIRAPGVHGTATLHLPRSSDDRSRSLSGEHATDALDTALRNTHVTEVRQIELTLQAAPAAVVGQTLRSTDGQDMLELQVPDLGPETGQLVLACDESGVLTWHLPVDEQQRIQTPATRGVGRMKRFLIPATRPAPAHADETTKRGFLGIIGKKLLKVLIYPVLDPIIGTISEAFAENWEEHNRPYLVRDFSPDNFRNASDKALAHDDWQRLAEGRSLLFIHGTFSSAHSAFSEIPESTFSELHQRYEGRVFAFNHFTLSHDPQRNIEWLLAQIPSGLSLDSDIICHSRGGLVARTLAQKAYSTNSDAQQLKIGRIIFFGAPNNGTLLTQPDHMVQMLDRLTTALNLFPTGAITETLEAIVSTLKVVAHGALKGLHGLAAMCPGGAFLTKLNSSQEDGQNYYAVGADYEPENEGLKALITGKITDAVMDRVFEQVPNDLVVPEPGVYGPNGSSAFPIMEQHCLKVPVSAGIMHTRLFTYTPAMERLNEWLS